MTGISQHDSAQSSGFCPGSARWRRGMENERGLATQRESTTQAKAAVSTNCERQQGKRHGSRWNLPGAPQTRDGAR